MEFVCDYPSILFGAELILTTPRSSCVYGLRELPPARMDRGWTAMINIMWSISRILSWYVWHVSTLHVPGEKPSSELHAGTTRKLGQWSCAPKMGTGFTPGWYSMIMHDLYGWKLRFMVILLISIWIASFIWVWFENSAPLNPWSYFSSKKCAKKLPFRCIPHFQTQSLGKSTIEGIYDGNRRGQVLSGFMKYPHISMKYPWNIHKITRCFNFQPCFLHTCLGS